MRQLSCAFLARENEAMALTRHEPSADRSRSRVLSGSRGRLSSLFAQRTSESSLRNAGSDHVLTFCRAVTAWDTPRRSDDMALMDFSDQPLDMIGPVYSPLRTPLATSVRKDWEEVWGRLIHHSGTEPSTATTLNEMGRDD